MNKNERAELEAKLADLKGRAEQFLELGNETAWDDEIKQLEKALGEDAKPKAKAGEKSDSKTEELNDGS